MYSIFVFVAFLYLVRFCTTLTFVNEEVNIKQLQNDVATKVVNFADDLLKFSSLERIYNQTSKTSQRNNHEALNNIVISIRKRLKKGKEVLLNNKNAIETQHISKRMEQNYSIGCCEHYSDSTASFSQMFIGNVVEKMCYVEPKGGSCRGHLYPYLNDHFRQNAEDLDVVLWQYYGSSDGCYVQYPTDRTICTKQLTSDHRFQKWFVNTASQQKKNIVIIIDESGSMSMNTGGPNRTDTPRRIDLAKEAANTVLGTLGPTDYVGIVAFNKTARIPTGCLGTKVVQASEHNKVLLRKFISSLEPEGGTYYGEAFSVAFRLLSTAKTKDPDQFENSLDLILFLTDGHPTDSQTSIFNVLVDGQVKMNHTVHILVYGLGQEIQHDIQNIGQFLLQLADQNNMLLSHTGRRRVRGGANLQWQGLPTDVFNNSNPNGPPGNVTFIADADGDRLKSIMGKYYTQFPVQDQDEMIISRPHVKGDVGLVLTLSMCTSAGQRNCAGVTAIDLPIDLTFYEAVHFQDDRNNYAFVTGENGVVLYHPLLRRPSYKDVVLRTVDELEPTLGTEAKHNITTGLPGMSAVKKQYLDEDGQSQSTMATFYYMPVPGFQGTLTVSLVVLDDEEQEIFQNMSTFGPVPELLAQIFDYSCAEQMNVEICASGDILFLKNTSTMFVPEASSDCTKQFELQFNGTCFHGGSFNDTSSFADNYNVSMKAAADAYLTKGVETEWQTLGDFIWRYLGTENGMLKVYPGTIISYPYYDPRLDEWYTKALKQRGRFVFLTFNDTVTVAKAFTLAGSGQIAGVVAADITSRHMTTFFANVMETCSNNHRCFLIDNNGYVFGHSGHLSLEDKLTNQHHLTHDMPTLANQLIQDGIMKNRWCVDLLSGDKALSYKVFINSSEEFAFNNSTDVCRNYIITPVNTTNLYLLLYPGSQMCHEHQKSTMCPCKENCDHCSAHQDICQCPCLCSAKESNSCYHNSTAQDAKIPCQGSGRHWRSLTRKDTSWSNAKGNVTECHKTCTSHLSKTSCESVSGCSWCETGHYKHYPICSRNCIIDRMNLEYLVPCINITAVDDDTIRKMLELFQKKIVDKVNTIEMNLTVHLPTKVQKSLRVTIDTTDFGTVPGNAIYQVLSSPVILHTNLSNSTGELMFIPRGSFTQMNVILHLHGINFTSELQHALTLRAHVGRVMGDFVRNNFQADIADTLDNVWPDEDIISFSLNVHAVLKSSTVLKYLEDLKQKIQISPITFDLLGTNATVYNVSYRPSYENVCKTPCNMLLQGEPKTNKHLNSVLGDSLFSLQKVVKIL